MEFVEQKVVPPYRRRDRSDVSQREYAENVRWLEEQELGGQLESAMRQDVDRSEIDSTLTGIALHNVAT